MTRDGGRGGAGDDRDDEKLRVDGVSAVPELPAAFRGLALLLSLLLIEEAPPLLSVPPADAAAAADAPADARAAMRAAAEKVATVPRGREDGDLGGFAAPPSMPSPPAAADDGFERLRLSEKRIRSRLSIPRRSVESCCFCAREGECPLPSADDAAVDVSAAAPAAAAALAAAAAARADATRRDDAASSLPHLPPPPTLSSVSESRRRMGAAGGSCAM